MKKFFKLGLIIAISMIVMVFFFACGGGEEAQAPAEEQEETETAAPASDEEIIVVGTNWQHPYWNDIVKGAEYAEEVLGVKMTISGPNTFDSQAQAEAVLQAIGQEPTGIMVAAYEPVVVPAIKKSLEAGIPTVTFESDIAESGRMCFVGVNNYDYGTQLGKNLVSGTGESGTLAISTNAGASNSEERIRGLEDYLTDYPGWEIVGTTEDKADVQVGADAAKALLQNYPDLDAYIGINASSGPAIGVAAQELGRDNLDIYCCDRDQTALDMIREGTIISTVVAKTASNPYYAALVLLNYARGGKDLPITSDNEAANINTMPNNIFVGSFVIDADNVEFF